jgi:hypothetical protein
MTSGRTAYKLCCQIELAPLHRGANVNVDTQFGETPLSAAAGQIPSGSPAPRDPDPDGARQVAIVRELLRLRLGAGTSPPPLPNPHHPALNTNRLCNNMLAKDILVLRVPAHTV